ncbi:flagellar biosynthetic protein FliO [Hoeflea poritis]|uniref:Flagellar biosynthetic protein FliO n=1 Tax=Hoeflea poritis TaxID=2993659 RepID=A0ABT4VU70_9HYPH|nr:flagellar biosynthetic protein FliO [Hoeflea poritis]MDA4848247.1 flagellar biosynthetic protein FliO [Hoeflea poritis]
MGDALFSTDGMSLYSMLAVGLVILVAIGLLVWNLRRRGHMAFIRGGNSRQPRLAVLDATAVDARRRLVLVRRDNVEHLIMIGGPSDIVVERGINRAAMRAAQQDATAQQPAKPAQRPQQQKAPPPQKPAEPIATEPLNIPAAKPTDKPQEQPKAETAAAKSAPEPETQKKPEQKTEQKAEISAKPLVEPKPAAEAKPVAPEKPAPELAAVAVSAAVADAAANPADKADTKPDMSAAPDIREEPKPLIKAEKPEDETIAAELEDVLDAARDLVLPEKEMTPPVLSEAVEAEAKIESKAPEPQSPLATATAGIPVVDTAPTPPESIDTSPTVTADELIADFDRVLEAEMSKAEKQKLAVETPEPVEPPQPEKEEPVKPPAASLEDEMKKLLGDLTVKH